MNALVIKVLFLVIHFCLQNNTEKLHKQRVSGDFTQIWKTIHIIVDAHRKVIGRIKILFSYQTTCFMGKTWYLYGDNSSPLICKSIFCHLQISFFSGSYVHLSTITHKSHNTDSIIIFGRFAASYPGTSVHAAISPVICMYKVLIQPFFNSKLCIMYLFITGIRVHIIHGK